MKALGAWSYKISDRLGGGGYADVYRCHRTDTPGQFFAIKVLKNPKHVKTLKRELDALALMDGCPGVPRIIDHGRDLQGKLCLVMALMPGRRLDRVIRTSGPMPEKQSLEMAKEILGILKVAHGKDLLHKDITPGNILIDRSGVSLIDWGVSELAGDGRAPHIRSKREYCAPEYFYYQHCKGSDFYSLAWVLFYAMTGRQPYHFDLEKDSGYRIVAHVIEKPILDQNISKDTRSLIENWLSKQPKERDACYSLENINFGEKNYNISQLTLKDFSELKNIKSYWELGRHLDIGYAKAHHQSRQQNFED